VTKKKSMIAPIVNRMLDVRRVSFIVRSVYQSKRPN
jgi:hypothetical protein